MWIVSMHLFLLLVAFQYETRSKKKSEKQLFLLNELFFNSRLPGLDLQPWIWYPTWRLSNTDYHHRISRRALLCLSGAVQGVALSLPVLQRGLLQEFRRVWLCGGTKLFWLPRRIWMCLPWEPLQLHTLSELQRSIYNSLKLSECHLKLCILPQYMNLMKRSLCLTMK